MHKLSFSKENSELFDAAYQALVLSGPPAVDTWEDYISLMRKFKQVGKEGDFVKEAKVQLFVYNEPCTLELERAEMKILKERVSQPIWIPSALERVMLLKKMLEASADENGLKVV